MPRCSRGAACPAVQSARADAAGGNHVGALLAPRHQLVADAAPAARSRRIRPVVRRDRAADLGLRHQPGRFERADGHAGRPLRLATGDRRRLAADRVAEHDPGDRRRVLAIARAAGATRTGRGQLSRAGGGAPGAHLPPTGARCGARTAHHRRAPEPVHHAGRGRLARGLDRVPGARRTCGWPPRRWPPGCSCGA